MSAKRLVLFDIDETMISTGGAGGRALGKALTQTHQVPVEKTKVSMSGKTDPQIIFEILTACGHDHDAARKAHEVVLPVYLNMLDAEIDKSERLILHPGVIELLEELVKKDTAYLGLVTGNVELGAKKKLTRFNLAHYFPIGAYGCDSANRLDLPAIAVQRAKQHFKQDFDASHTVIIGDSVGDIACGHGYGAKVIAVNTGKTSWDSLAEHKPRHLLKNLSDTQAVLDAIFD